MADTTEQLTEQLLPPPTPVPTVVTKVRAFLRRARLRGDLMRMATLSFDLDPRVAYHDRPGAPSPLRQHWLTQRFVDPRVESDYMRFTVQAHSLVTFGVFFGFGCSLACGGVLGALDNYSAAWVYYNLGVLAAGLFTVVGAFVTLWLASHAAEAAGVKEPKTSLEAALMAVERSGRAAWWVEVAAMLMFLVVLLGLVAPREYVLPAECPCSPRQCLYSLDFTVLAVQALLMLTPPLHMGFAISAAVADTGLFLLGRALSPEVNDLHDPQFPILVAAYAAVTAAVSLVLRSASAMFRREFVRYVEVHEALRRVAGHRAFLVRLLDAAVPQGTLARLAAAGTLQEAAVFDESPHAAVVVAGIADFERWGLRLLPGVVVRVLHELFTAYDAAAKQLHLTKAATYGDRYVACAGLHSGQAGDVDSFPGGVSAATTLALHTSTIAASVGTNARAPCAVRAAVAAGPLCGGIDVASRLRYCVTGHALESALALLEHCPPQHVVVDGNAAAALAIMPAAFRLWGVVAVCGGVLTAVTDARCAAPAVDPSHAAPDPHSVETSVGDSYELHSLSLPSARPTPSHSRAEPPLQGSAQLLLGRGAENLTRLVEQRQASPRAVPAVGSVSALLASFSHASTDEASAHWNGAGHPPSESNASAGPALHGGVLASVGDAAAAFLKRFDPPSSFLLTFASSEDEAAYAAAAASTYLARATPVLVYHALLHLTMLGIFVAERCVIYGWDNGSYRNLLAVVFLSSGSALFAMMALVTHRRWCCFERCVVDPFCFVFPRRVAPMLLVCGLTYAMFMYFSGLVCAEGSIISNYPLGLPALHFPLLWLLIELRWIVAGAIFIGAVILPTFGMFFFLSCRSFLFTAAMLLAEALACITAAYVFERSSRRVFAIAQFADACTALSEERAAVHAAALEVLLPAHVVRRLHAADDSWRGAGGRRVPVIEHWPSMVVLAVRLLSPAALAVSGAPGAAAAAGAAGGVPVQWIFRAVGAAVDAEGHGHMHLVQTLGDTYLVAGPLNPDAVAGARDALTSAAARAAVGVARYLGRMLWGSGHGMTAALVADDGFGALLGTDALSYRLFGVAPRTAHALLAAVPVAATPVVAATREFRRVYAGASAGDVLLAPVLGAGDFSTAVAPEQDACGADAVFNAPQLWRLRDEGALHVSTLVS